MQATALEIPGELRQRYPDYFASPRRPDGRFHNPWPHEHKRRFTDVLRWRFGGRPPKRVVPRPQAPQPVHDNALADFEALPHGARMLWPGHASFWFELDGATVAIDPILGKIARMIPRVTPLPLEREQLPTPDVLLLSHGHFDHLDIASVAGLCKRPNPPVVIVPTGLARQLPRACERVVEVSWWEQVSISGLRFSLVPAQHWHKRAAADTDRALWGGWVVQGSRSIYHTGDTGYFGGFAAIGAVFDIDVACMPLGAYEPRWFMGGQHMAPEDTVRAFEQVGARHMFGMHWGTFDLSDEALDDGPKLLRKIIDERGLDPERFVVVQPGGSLAIGDGHPTVNGTRPAW